MIRRIRELARERADFAFETTLASRGFAPWLAELRKDGYLVHVIFLWLPSAGFAVDRVLGRVRMGGHDVPENVVRRRYGAGLRNFFELYQPLADTWRVYDNSKISGPLLVAAGKGVRITQVVEKAVWEQIRKEYGSGSQSK